MISPEQLIIIGSGPAGLTAAIYASRSNLKPLLIEGSQPGGQLMGTTYVENWPGDKKVLGPALMMRMREHAQAFGTRFESGQIVRVDFSKKPFILWNNKDKKYQADSVIIATGAIPKKLGVPGENQYWGKGITTCAVCDGAFYKEQKVIIVGGGDTAMEDASFMTKFTKDITIVQILDTLTASHAMQQKVIHNPDIKIMYNTTVSQVLGDGNHVTGISLTDQKTGNNSTLDVNGIFLAIGLKPNTSPFIGQIELDKWGYIKVHGGSKTSVEGVFAAGDVHDYIYRQAVTSAGAGCKAALDAQRYLS